MELGKQAVEVHKQVLESLKTPSEIAKNLGVADYYQAGARLHDYHRSAQYVTDQVMIHQAGVRAQYEEMQNYEKFKMELRKGTAAEFGDIKAPIELARLTGMSYMRDIAKYFGPENLEKLLAVAENRQMRLDAAARQHGQQEFSRLLTNYTGLLGKVKDYDKLIKDAIPLDKWNAMTPSQQATAKFNGGYPLTDQLKNNAAIARKMLDNVGRDLYKDKYIPEAEMPTPVFDVTPRDAKGNPIPPGQAPNAGVPGTPVTRGWLGDLYNWMTKERVPQETIDKYRQMQNPHGA